MVEIPEKRNYQPVSELLQRLFNNRNCTPPWNDTDTIRLNKSVPKRLRASWAWISRDSRPSGVFFPAVRRLSADELCWYDVGFISPTVPWEKPAPEAQTVLYPCHWVYQALCRRMERQYASLFDSVAWELFRFEAELWYKIRNKGAV